VHRNADGTVTFNRSEVRLIRAAFFTIEHYADQVWDEQEVHAVSGYPLDAFSHARHNVDALATSEDRHADAIDRVRGNLELFETRDDEWFVHERRLRALRSVVDESQSIGQTVSARLLTFADQ
jgi:hypothetical protein